MAYEKQTWQTGDIVTANKLNHMEDGIAESYNCETITLTDNEDDGTYQIDKTFDEISELRNIPVIKLRRIDIVDGETRVSDDGFCRIIYVRTATTPHEEVGYAIATDFGYDCYGDYSDDEDGGFYTLSNLSTRFNGVVVKRDGSVIGASLY